MWGLSLNKKGRSKIPSSGTKLVKLPFETLVISSVPSFSPSIVSFSEPNWPLGNIWISTSPLVSCSTTPLSSTVLGHFYTKNEKFNLVKTIGILIGFSGIIFLFSDNLLIDENNFGSALLILLGSTCYVIGGVLTLKISKKKNENVTGSILIWAIIILIPLASFIEQPWNITPRLDSIISVIYLGFVSTGIAWLLYTSPSPRD